MSRKSAKKRRNIKRKKAVPARRKVAVLSPDDDPTFGYFTNAKLRPGSPDLELSSLVSKMLSGDFLPGKKVIRFEISATYSDGQRQIMFESTKPCLRVFSDRTTDGVLHFTIDELPLTENSNRRHRYGLDRNRPG